MKMLNDLIGKKAELQITPLIDVVFLLLIYFMVTSSLVKKEADLSFLLPAKVDTADPIALPIEALIEISDVGDVTMEGMRYGVDGTLNDLIQQLETLKEAAASSGSELIVNILPSDMTRHQYIINVMDACAAAHVKNLSFSMSM
jgi:biopolymer transport protein ExbD